MMTIACTASYALSTHSSAGTLSVTLCYDYITRLLMVANYVIIFISKAHTTQNKTSYIVTVLMK